MSAACPARFLTREAAMPEVTFRSDEEVLEVWREYARDVRGRALPCGHYLAEERPGETAGELVSFLEDRGC